MIVVRDIHDALPACALAIGNFDGVHLGHQAILADTVAAARSRHLIPAVMTFEPLPREVFDRTSAPPRLSSVREKLEAFRDAGIERVHLVRFNRAFAAQMPDEFIALLRQRLNARWLMVGADFRFGAKRAGGLEELRAAAKAKAFDLALMPDVMVDGARVSSTRVRDALAAGDLHAAERLLGREYTVSGHVVHGDKRGRTLGFPTANVALGRFRKAKPPLAGVYAVKCCIAGSLPVIGAASLGRNPAVKENGPPSLEVHLLGRAGDLYGRRMSVAFHAKVRDEAHYATLDELKRAIADDCNAVTTYFERHPS